MQIHSDHLVADNELVALTLPSIMFYPSLYFLDDPRVLGPKNLIIKNLMYLIVNLFVKVIFVTS